jgi:Zn-dependent protease with chaperone function
VLPGPGRFILRALRRRIIGRLLGLALIAVPVGLFGAAGLVGVLVTSALVALVVGYVTVTGEHPAVRSLESSLKEDRRVTAAVTAIGARARMPIPRSGVTERVGTQRFQAIALRRPEPGMVVVTRPLLNDLADNELTAVIAHELAHVWHPIRGQLLIASVWGLLGGVIVETGYAFALFGPHLQPQAFVYSPLAFVLLFVFARPLLALIPRAVARHGEFKADAWACRLGCDGTCLATGLWELTLARAQQQANRPGGSRPALERARRIRAILAPSRRSWTAAQRRAALLQLCRSDLAAEHLTERLFSTHPSVTRRTRRLLKSPTPHGKPVSDAGTSERAAPGG